MKVIVVNLAKLQVTVATITYSAVQIIKYAWTWELEEHGVTVVTNVKQVVQMTKVDKALLHQVEMILLQLVEVQLMVQSYTIVGEELIVSLTDCNLLMKNSNTKFGVLKIT